MKTKILNFAFLLSVIISAATFSACSNDEPKSPGDEPIPEPEPPVTVMTEAEINKILEGSWVAVDKEKGWRHAEFTLNEDGTHSYQWLEGEKADTRCTIEVTGGGWRVINSASATPSVIFDQTFHTPNISVLQLTLTGVNSNEICLKMRYSQSDIEASRATEEMTMHRVLSSFFGVLEQQFEVPLSVLTKDQDFTIGQVLDPTIAIFDEETSTITVKGFGTTYLPITIGKETAFIEVVGSPLVEMPLPFASYLGDCATSHSQEPGSELFPFVRAFDKKYEGIRQITYWAGYEFHTIAVFGAVNVEVEETVYPYARWIIANRTGRPFDTYYYQGNYVQFLISADFQRPYKALNVSFEEDNRWFKYDYVNYM